MFSAYRGRCLEVSEEVLAAVCDFFPEIDVREELFQMDAWLYSRPRRQWPRNTKRFVMNWCSKAERSRQREQAKELALRRELMVGGGPR